MSGLDQPCPPDSDEDQADLSESTLSEREQLKRSRAAEMDNEGHDWDMPTCEGSPPTSEWVPTIMISFVVLALWKLIDILIWVWHRIHSLSS